MNAANIAVWLLELVTSPDRAVTTVGDFMEESSERGRLWFWRQIVRTFVALVIREFISAGPGLIVKCILRSLAYLLVGGFTSVVFGRILGTLAMQPQPLMDDIRFTSAPQQFFIFLVATLMFLRAGWLLSEKRIVLLRRLPSS